MESKISEHIADQWITHLQHSVETGAFIKLTLSKPANPSADLKNVFARIIEIKGKEVFSFTLRYATNDQVKNHAIAEGLEIIRLWLGKDFLNAHLFTTEQEIVLQYSKKRKGRLFFHKIQHQTKASKAHDQEKHYLLHPEQAPYLKDLGIVSQSGHVLPNAQAKFRQINKYLEVIDSLIQEHALPAEPRIVDMGSGKGYLTFALYDFLKNQKQLQPRITGLELRPKLVDFCQATAQKYGMEGLDFQAMDIQDFEPGPLDMLIALHACDTATDLAIAKGIKAEATLLVLAPCCHKQIRKQMKGGQELHPLLRHGILAERQAEMVTDGIRALLMEAHAYKTKVFEFISLEHTGKNVMITGVKYQENPDALQQVAALKELFGIEYHYLEKLL
ncbi:MAG TPA: SAM-dependent methyltransferase [Saprospiraceae bacterium]|nr:SAM-dependent methyltransferase [Saprospiraceae bacterium]HMQ81614.1 SAM-dependent methyltransferase [Saprospiraceae bacterium]